MGNSHNKSVHHKNQKQSSHSARDGQAYSSQFSLSHFVGNLSGRSYVSVTSNQSVYSASRPWSRVSRRRWNDSTLKNPLEASKTAWPVAHKESIFLPEFPITTDLLHKDFQLVKKIAKGAYGEVYKVKKLSEDKEYALKVLRKSQIVSENAVTQVKEEARIQTACGHHSFIAGAVSRWQTKKRLYIVSEYIPGGELLALIDKCGKLPEELVKIFVAEIAIAIDFLHNAGVIYRDLKPENILLDSDFHIQLIDFGLSKWLSIGSRTTTLCGTLKYMAPEVLSREPYGHAADWWSLGVVVCYMMTGEVVEPVYFARRGTTATPISSVKHFLRFDGKFPAPAIGTPAINELKYNDGNSSSTKEYDVADNDHDGPRSVPSRPGTLPDCASELSNAARSLLNRLLDPDPKVRMKNIRQLQQTAFYMGFNFEHVKAKKVSPKPIFERHFPDHKDITQHNDNEQEFAAFGHSIFPL